MAVVLGGYRTYPSTRHRVLAKKITNKIKTTMRKMPQAASGASSFPASFELVQVTHHTGYYCNWLHGTIFLPLLSTYNKKRMNSASCTSHPAASTLLLCGPWPVSSPAGSPCFLGDRTSAIGRAAFKADRRPSSVPGFPVSFVERHRLPFFRTTV